MFIILIVLWFPQHINMSEFIDLYNLNMCRLLYIKYTSIKLFFFKLRKDSNRNTSDRTTELIQQKNHLPSSSYLRKMLQRIYTTLIFLFQPFKCLLRARYCLYVDNRHQSYLQKHLQYSFVGKLENTTIIQAVPLTRRFNNLLIH